MMCVMALRAAACFNGQACGAFGFNVLLMNLSIMYDE
jgi:hypothetical protein